jgi:spore coat protein A
VRLRNTWGSGSTSDVLAFRVGSGHRADDTRVPAQLSRIESLRPEAARVTRTFLLQNHGDEGWTINGAAYDPAHPLATPRLGVLERWRFVTDVHHPIHLHLNHFQVLSRNDEEPGPYDAGWKDTVDLRPAEAAEILVRFSDHPGRYVFHCHNLEHEDMAMMADFVVA